MSEKDFESSPEQAPAEQLSGKVVCDRLGVPHEQQPYAALGACVNPRPAQPQAKAPSLDARGKGDLTDGELAGLGAICSREGRVLTLLLIDEVKRRRAAPSAPSDALREAWIKGCLAGREEGADMVDSFALIEAPALVANKIRSLPAPIAPKGPQR